MTQIFDVLRGLGFKKENLLQTTILGVILFYSYTNFTTINTMNERELDKTKDAGLTVLKTLSEKELDSASEIDTFLSEKPAGRNDLKNACEIVFECLHDSYGNLAVKACSIFN